MFIPIFPDDTSSTDVDNLAENELDADDDDSIDKSVNSAARADSEGDCFKNYIKQFFSINSIYNKTCLRWYKF